MSARIEGPPVRMDTARLRLCPFTLDDIDVLHRLWTDPEVRRYLWDDEIIARDIAEEVVRASSVSFQDNRFGFWTLRLRTEESSIIGFCGLRFFGDPPEVEILYGLAPPYWGLGLATEAARAVLAYGFQELRLPRIWGGADLPNTASLRILQKLGMTYEKNVPTKLGESLYYSLTRNTNRGRDVEGG